MPKPAAAGRPSPPIIRSQAGGFLCQQKVHGDALLERIQQVGELMTEVSRIELFAGLAAQTVLLVGQVHGDGAVTKQERVPFESMCCRGVALKPPVLDQLPGKSTSPLVTVTFRKS